jgi:hypothetical protein
VRSETVNADSFTLFFGGPLAKEPLEPWLLLLLLLRCMACAMERSTVHPLNSSVIQLMAGNIGSN